MFVDTNWLVTFSVLSNSNKLCWRLHVICTKKRKIVLRTLILDQKKHTSFFPIQIPYTERGPYQKDICIRISWKKRATWLCVTCAPHVAFLVSYRINVYINLFLCYFIKYFENVPLYFHFHIILFYIVFCHFESCNLVSRYIPLSCNDCCYILLVYCDYRLIVSFFFVV